MKRILLLLLSIPILSFGQGSMDFENVELSSSYSDGVFTENGIEYTYGHSRDEDEFQIAGNGLMLGDASDSYFEWIVEDGIGELSFQYRKAFTGDSENQLEVYINDEVVATTESFGEDIDEQEEIYDFTVSVNIGEPATVRIINVGDQTGNNQTVIDNIVWTSFDDNQLLGDCEVPTEFSVQYDIEFGVVLVFVDGNPGDTYEIIYGNSGFNPAEEGITITTNEYVTEIEGLAEGEYDFYVRTICDEETNSVWLGPETVLVDDCEAPMEFFVVFDAEYGVALVFIDGYPGSTYEIIYGNSGFDPAQEGITLTTNEYVTEIAGLADGEYDFYVRTICDEETSSIWLGPETVLVDNVDCEIPMGFFVIFDEGSGAALVFVDGVPGSTFEIIYGISGFNPAEEGSTVTTEEYITEIGGLVNGVYDFYVRTICNENSYSDWLGPETAVVTGNEAPEECETPDEFYVDFNEEDNSVFVVIDGDPAYTYEVIYGLTGFDPNTEGTSIFTDEDPVVVVEGLENGEYDFYVRTICDEETSSDWLGPETFEVSIEDEVEECETPDEFYVDFNEEDNSVFVVIDGDPAYTYEVIYGLTGFDPNTEGTSIFTDEDPVVVIEGLENGEYDFYVRTICDEETNSDWLGPETFEVSIEDEVEECEIPDEFYVDFNEEDNSVFVVIDGDPAYTYEVIYGLTGFDPNTEGTSIFTDEDPVVVIEDLENGEYDFYVRTICDEETNSDWLGPETFEVSIEDEVEECETPDEFYVDFNEEDNSVFVVIDGDPTYTYEVIYGLTGFDPNTEGTSIYTDEDPVVVIEGLENGEYDFYVRTICDEETNSDWLGPETFEVSIDGEVEDCETPDEFSVDYNEEDNSVFVVIDGNPVYTYEVIYGLTGFDPNTEGTSIYTDEDPVVVIEGLENGEYDFYVRTICDEETNSDWLGPETFEVSIDGEVEDCETPDEFYVDFNEEDNSVFVVIDGDPTYMYEVIYGLTGFDPNTEGTSVFTDEDPVVVIEGLENGEYDFYVRTICDEETSSDWLGPETFEVSIEDEVEDCETPDEFSVDYNEEDNSVFVVIDGNPAYTYEVIYGFTGFDPNTEGTLVFTDEDPVVVIEGLENGEYDFYVRTICDEETNSDWLGPETVEVTEEEEPVVDCDDFTVTITGDSTFCEGESSVLTAVYEGTITSVLWNNGGTTDEITVTEAGAYSVTVVSDEACEATASITITVNPLPSVEGIGYVVNSDNSVSFTAEGVENSSSYNWTFGDGSSKQNDAAPTHFYDEIGFYTVTLTVSNDCGEVTVSVEIPVGVVGLSTEDLGSINLYPNPARNVVSIDYNGTSTMETVVIINTIGKIVYNGNASNANNVQLNIDSFGNGLYHVNIFLQDGNVIQRKLEVIK